MIQYAIVTHRHKIYERDRGYIRCDEFFDTERQALSFGKSFYDDAGKIVYEVEFTYDKWKYASENV